MRDWRRWRRTTLAWHEVAEARGQLYRPRGDGRYDKGRYEAALESRATAPSPRAMALAAWRRAGRDEALFAPSWDVWWGDYAESKGFNDVVVGGATTTTYTSTTTCRSSAARLRGRELWGVRSDVWSDERKMSLILLT